MDWCLKVALTIRSFNPKLKFLDEAFSCGLAIPGTVRTDSFNGKPQAEVLRAKPRRAELADERKTGAVRLPRNKPPIRNQL